jgi:hypothetical protein
MCNTSLNCDPDLMNLLIDLIKTSDKSTIFQRINKYLKDKITGVGCSIFLVNPMTDELYLEYSDDIPLSKKYLATYTRGEGFTGWVFKYKKFIYIKNEADKVELSKIKPEPPIHAGHLRGKPCETKKLGPFIAAPILSKGTWKFCVDDFKYLEDIVGILLDNNNLSRYLMLKLYPSTVYLLNDFHADKDNNDLVNALANDFNKLLEDRDLYNQNEFSQVLLSEETQKLISLESDDPDDVIILNRSLLEEVFSDKISKRYVIGVIRLPAMERKEEFSREEIDIFLTFAARISEPIENAYLKIKQYQLINTYHKIGKYNNLSEYSLISSLDLKDGDSLIRKINEANDPISKYVFNIIGKEKLGKCLEFADIDTQKADESIVSDQNKPVFAELIDAINDIIQGPCIYDESRFTHIKLSETAKIMIIRHDLMPDNKSESIALNSRLLNEAYPNEIGIDPVSRLLMDVVENIPDIVGGGGCSIFLHEGGRTEDNRRKFVLRASTSVARGYHQHMNKGYYYIESEKGVTPFVLRNGITMRLNNINNPIELAKYSTKYNDPNLAHIEGGPCEIPSMEVGPFLAVPIKNEEYTIGAIRIPRHKGAIPFDEQDEKLLSAFSNQLSLVMWNLTGKEMLQRREIEKLSKFYETFSIELVRNCRDLKHLNYADEIKQFMTFQNHSSIQNAILDLMDDLLRKKYEQYYNFPLLEDFKSYEVLLLELPGYRDHFIHQFQVFLLGSIIIELMYKESFSDENSKRSSGKKAKSFSDYYHLSLHMGAGPRSEDFEADLAWLIASCFHDVAYPIQRSDQLFNNFFKKFMGLDNIVEKVSLCKVFLDSNYGKLIDELCDLYVNLKFCDRPWKYDSRDIRNIYLNDRFNRAIRISLMEKRDHGVLGSLILLHQSKGGGAEYSKIIYPAALAIALHNDIFKNSLQDNILFEENPLGFLLIYCDLIQEWGRGKDDTLDTPKLKNIQVRYDNNDDKIHIETSVLVGDLYQAENKANEAEAAFKRLISSEIVFEFIIENTGRKFISKHKC